MEVTYRSQKREVVHYKFVKDEQPLPKCFVGKRDLLSGDELGDDTKLKQYDVILVSIHK